jgi:cell division septum initiation protein DivIVA
MRRKSKATDTPFAERLQAWCAQQPEVAELREAPRALRRAIGAEAARIVVGVPVDANFAGANRKARRTLIRQARHARNLQLEAFRAKGKRKVAQANRRAVRIMKARVRGFEAERLLRDDMPKAVTVTDVTDPALD